MFEGLFPPFCLKQKYSPCVCVNQIRRSEKCVLDAKSKTEVRVLDLCRVWVTVLDLYRVWAHRAGSVEGLHRLTVLDLCRVWVCAQGGRTTARFHAPLFHCMRVEPLTKSLATP